ncbi:MAG: hypothetical protein AAB254_07960, partial [candidate division NC10 bacterium]
SAWLPMSNRPYARSPTWIGRSPSIPGTSVRSTTEGPPASSRETYVQLGAGPLPPGAWDRLLALGFEVVRELPLPPALGRPGRRVVALRRVA